MEKVYRQEFWLKAIIEPKVIEKIETSFGTIHLVVLTPPRFEWGGWGECPKEE